ncbi:hypothetical protein [uncultured Bacteroides sp.]|uniref:hypothetical protein n=1 Tax=uncultured Bacteroides sp. TaxID=162156 RepID=UPI002AAC1FE3|nr:hypothetical protein [uncultured Bacteroides sp.]
MPYRRLPNTDQARIRALKKAVEKGELYNYNDLPFSVRTLNEAETFLARFEQAHNYYKQCFNNQISSSQKYQPSVKMARIYVSHFIQVLNLAVTRSEIKEEQKTLYGLDPKDYAVPDLTNESSIIEWGSKIIKGEKERNRRGGTPIYNPTIAKVSVHYEIFKDGYDQQKHLQWQTARSLDMLASLREKADGIILDIWNQVEKSFENLSGTERLNQCQDYGVVYYYRTGENKPQ